MSAQMAALQPQHPYFKGVTLALVTIALALGTFMEVLDTTIANVAIPHIAGDLGVSPTQATWVITSYAIANAISMLLSGWLAQRFGQVRVFVGAVLLFTLASWLCGLAVSFGMLLMFRVMQGGVSGLMVPLSQTLLLSNYPAEKRGIALAIWAMTVVVAPVVGPIAGGWLTDNIGWPWIFYINIPVGLLAALLTWRLLAARDTPTRRVPVDVVGLALIVIWVGALQIMLDKGSELDWFGSTYIVALAAVAALGLALFVVWELTEENPIVDLRLFKVRNLTAGAIALSLGYGLYIGNIVLLPLWLQTQMGYTATWAGLVLAPSGVLAFLFSPAVGKNLMRVDPRLFATAALLVFALSSFWRAGFTAEASYMQLALPQLIIGIGVAMFFTPLFSIAAGNLSPDKAALGSGLTNFLRITAGSFGTSLATTFWERREAVHHTQLVEHITAFTPQAGDVMNRLGDMGLGGDQILARINRVLTQQTSLLAANDIFWISGWVFALLVASVWFARKPFGTTAAGH
jgi:DHA2 family multidrug resistance protein